MINWFREKRERREKARMEKNGLKQVANGTERKKEVTRKIHEMFEERRVPPRMTEAHRGI